MPDTPPTTSAPPAPAAAPTPLPKTNVLLVGSGGREHALAWKLRQSPRLGDLYSTSPENPGLAALCKPAPVATDPRDAFAIRQFCIANRIGLAVIGPEEPLAAGLADALLSGGGGGLAGAVQAVFGPVKAAAALEADKAFAKDLMRSAAIPTADARAFTDHQAARAYLESRTEPHVIKAAGLAKGKGVFVPASQAEALAALDRVMLGREFGDAGRTVVIEERLKGREVSVFALVDGRNIFVLEPCQDHKRVGDGATGPNTGGMGALCPTPAIDDRTLARVQREVIVPTIDALRRDGIEYTGVLYVGLMLTHAGPKVLEFNVRFGDPECQALMPKLQGDLVEIMLACSTRSLDKVELTSAPGAAVCVVIASEGYPEKPRLGVPIEGLADAAALDHVTIFHSGTRLDDRGRVVTAGGRVLSITALGPDRDTARARAYAAANLIRFPGKVMRTDIGTDVVG